MYATYPPSQFHRSDSNYYSGNPRNFKFDTVRRVDMPVDSSMSAYASVSKSGSTSGSQYARSVSSQKRYYDNKVNYNNSTRRETNNSANYRRSSPVSTQSKDRKHEPKKAKGPAKPLVAQNEAKSAASCSSNRDQQTARSYDNNGYHNRYSTFYQRKSYSVKPTPMKRFYHIADEMTFTEKPKDLLNGTSWDKLSSDMWTLYSARRQSSSLFTSKIRIWERLYKEIREVEPTYSLYMVGSTVNGFGIDGSDIDLCLMLHNIDIDQSSDAPRYLNQIRDLASRSPDLMKDSMVIYAKVPLLKFRDPETDLNIDLNVNNSVGIRNTHLLHCYSELDWRVKPLGLLVKEWARRHGINDAKSMTLSSYSLTLMVIHYLQCAVSPAILPCLQEMHRDKFNPTSQINKINSLERMKPYKTENTQTLGELFLGFFVYYSRFDFGEKAISVRKGTTLPFQECQYAAHPKNDPGQWKCIGIEEPFDRTNTARAVFDVYKFEHICNAIHQTAEILGRTLDLSMTMDPANLYLPYQQLYRI